MSDVETRQTYVVYMHDGICNWLSGLNQDSTIQKVLYTQLLKELPIEYISVNLYLTTIQLELDWLFYCIALLTVLIQPLARIQNKPLTIIMFESDPYMTHLTIQTSRHCVEYRVAWLSIRTIRWWSCWNTDTRVPVASTYTDELHRRNQGRGAEEGQVS